MIMYKGTKDHLPCHVLPSHVTKQYFDLIQSIHYRALLNDLCNNFIGRTLSNGTLARVFSPNEHAIFSDHTTSAAGHRSILPQQWQCHRPHIHYATFFCLLYRCHLYTNGGFRSCCKAAKVLSFVFSCPIQIVFSFGLLQCQSNTSSGQ